MQTEATEKDSRRRFLWPGLTGILVLGVVAMACHPFPMWHTESMHSVGDAETVCIHVQGYPAPIMDFDQAKDAIIGVLADPNVGGPLWIDAGDKVSFSFASGDCDTLSPSARAAYEIEVHVVDIFMIQEICGVGSACAEPDLTTEETHGEHKNYGKYLVYVDEFFYPSGSFRRGREMVQRQMQGAREP